MVMPPTPSWQPLDITSAACSHGSRLCCACSWLYCACSASPASASPRSSDQPTAQTHSFKSHDQRSSRPTRYMMNALAEPGDLSGLEQLRAIFSGRTGYDGIIQLLQLRPVSAEQGFVVF